MRKPTLEELVILYENERFSRCIEVIEKFEFDKKYSAKVNVIAGLCFARLNRKDQIMRKQKCG